MPGSPIKLCFCLLKRRSLKVANLLEKALLDHRDLVRPSLMCCWDLQNVWYRCWQGSWWKWWILFKCSFAWWRRKGHWCSRGPQRGSSSLGYTRNGGFTEAAREATQSSWSGETDHSCVNASRPGPFPCRWNGTWVHEGLLEMLKCTFLWVLIFVLFYDLPAEFFHGIKDMARKQEHVHTHTQLTQCSFVSHNPDITYGLSGRSIVCCLVLELLLKIGCHLQSSGHMFTQT